MSTTDEHDDGTGDAGGPGKKVFLVAAFRAEPGRATDGGPTASVASSNREGRDDPEGRGDREGQPSGPISGMAEHVVAVIGSEGDHRRFEWVGDGQQDSVASPALVTPIRVRLGVPSPWHPTGDGMVTGLVQLAPEQLGAGNVDDDLDRLLSQLGQTRRPGPARPEVG